MAEWIIPEHHWAKPLIDAVITSAPGDVIVVLDPVMTAFVQDAREKFCPDKPLTVVVRQLGDPHDHP